MHRALVPRRAVSTVIELVCIVAAFLALAAAPRVAHAQAARAPATSASAERDKIDKSEEEAPDSPRASVRNFLDLAEHGRYDDAAIYLDVPKGNEKRAPELASKLYVVLSQRLLLNPEQLSGLPQGVPDHGLPAGVEEVGKITDAKGRPVAIRLVRHDSRGVGDEPRWLFSQTTVAQVDTLYAALRDRWLRDRLPARLLASGPLSLYYWQWLALPLLAMLCVVAGRFLSFCTAMIARPLLDGSSWTAHLLVRLKRPATLGWSLVLFALLIPGLSLTLKAEDLTERVLRALAYLAFFWALLRTVGVFGDELRSADWARSRPTARSLAAVGVSLGKVVVAALALMVALTELGYPVTSVVAGLGIGGVALALAAQKTVENLFGSLSILADQPFLVGDSIKVDTVEGTVESIGLRSTRVRTVDRTLVIFPNGKLADMRIESYGPRDRIRFATRLSLSRRTTTAQIQRIVAAVKETLNAHPSIRKEDVIVHLAGIGEASYDVEVAAAVETTDWMHFARVREQLLIACVQLVEDHGAELAVPTRRVLESWPNASAAADTRAGSA